MRGSCITSLVVSAILATLPAAAFANGPGGGGHLGFSGHVVSFGLGSNVGRPMTPIRPGWGSWTPGRGWLGGPGAFGASPSGFALAPFHTPYAAPFWSGTAASIAMKPDEATVLESESRMEEQIRTLEAPRPKDESSEKGSDAASDGDRSEWQPL